MNEDRCVTVATKMVDNIDTFDDNIVYMLTEYFKTNEDALTNFENFMKERNI